MLQDRTLGVCEAARLLSANRQAVALAVHSGQLPAFKFGKRFRIPLAALQRLLDEGTTPLAASGHESHGD